MRRRHIAAVLTALLTTLLGGLFPFAMAETKPIPIPITGSHLTIPHVDRMYIHRKEPAMSATVRPRHMLHITPQKGLNMVSSPLDVAPGRPVDLQNLIGEGHILVKRTGWQQMARIRDTDTNGDPVYPRIHGMWPFDDGYTSCLIVHAGQRLYRVDPTAWTWTALNPELPLADAPGMAFGLGGRLWMVGAGGFFSFGTEDGGERYRARPVRELDVYIPVTTVGISDTTSETDARTSLDPVNLLTAQRKNRMAGRDTSEDIPERTWKLDGRPRRGTSVTVEIEILRENGETVIYHLKTGNYVEATMGGGSLLMTATATLVPAEDQPTDSGSYTRTLGHVNYQSGEITLEGVGFDTSGAVIRTMQPPASGVDNITVTFEADIEDRADLLDTATVGILFGEGGLSDRLILGGFARERNRLYYSAPGDPTYFPDTHYLSAGSDMARIVGLSRISDGVVAIHKEQMSHTPTIYYMEMNGEIAEETLTVRVTPHVTAGGCGEEVVAPNALCDLGGDPLVLTDSGVMAVTMRKDLATAERQLIPRSRAVTPLFRRMSRTIRSQAVAACHGGRCYIAFPGSDQCLCLVAQEHDTYTADGTRQYEWYPWANIPATAFCIMDDRLCFGTEDGRLCLFSDVHNPPTAGSLYADRLWTAFSTGDVTYNYQDGRLAYDPRVLDVAAGDLIRLDTGLFEDLLPSGFSISSGILTARDRDEIMHLHEGMTVLFDGVDPLYGIASGQIYKIGHVDRAVGLCNLITEEGHVATISHPNTDSLRLLTPLDGRELSVAAVHADGDYPYITVTNHPDDEDPLRITTRQDLAVVSELVGIVIRDTPVCAWFCTGYIAPGGYGCEKTIHAITVTATPESERVTVLCESRTGEDRSAPESAAGPDLARLLFSDFTFAGFARSHTRTICRRRVNFIRVRYTSTDPVPCCVQDIAVTYTAVGIKRGGY